MPEALDLQYACGPQQTSALDQRRLLCPQTLAIASICGTSLNIAAAHCITHTARVYAKSYLHSHASLQEASPSLPGHPGAHPHRSHWAWQLILSAGLPGPALRKPLG